MKTEVLVRGVIVFLSFLLLWVFAISFLDPDFGWHIRLGHSILTFGIPKTDPLSYTMPSFPFIDHEWLSNVFIYTLYTQIGFYGLAGVFALICVFAFLIPTNFLSKKGSVPVFILTCFANMIFFGVRVQVLSWFFFAILLYVLSRQKKQYFFFLPLLFFIWVNMHASFAFGILVFGLYTILSFITKDKDKYIKGWFFILSVAVTGITPYGFRMWVEVWNQITDIGLHSHILEWEPFLSVGFGVLLLCLLPLSIICFTFCFKKISLFQKCLYILLIFMSISSIRHVPFLILQSVWIFLLAYENFYQQAQKIPFGKDRLKKLTIFFTGGVVLLVIVQTMQVVYQRWPFSFDTYYPTKAVQVLKKLDVKGNIFSVYNWGGYLSWQMPEKKVFIDGRMPSWKRKSAPKNESSNAFEEYSQIAASQKKFSSTIKKYEITVFLLPTVSEKVETKETVFISKKLQANGFKKVYADTVATVYRK